VVREALGEDPFSGTIFIFRSKRADRLKIVTWDGTGLVLLWKRLGMGPSGGRMTKRTPWPHGRAATSASIAVRFPPICRASM
jgi:hypothetical protein